MRNMKSKVNIDDFLTIIYWVRTFYLIEGKEFNYQNLLDQAETYKIKNTPLDTSIHQIDQLMIDAFKIYHRLKETEVKVQEIFNQIQLPFFDKDQMMVESKRYQAIFEDLLENYKYEDPEIRGIQKGFLIEKLEEYKYLEEYEKCAKIRDTLKEC